MERQGTNRSMKLDVFIKYVLFCMYIYHWLVKQERNGHMDYKQGQIQYEYVYRICIIGLATFVKALFVSCILMAFLFAIFIPFNFFFVRFLISIGR